MIDRFIHILILLLIFGFLGLDTGKAQVANPELLAHKSRLTESENLSARIDSFLSHSTENGFSGSVLVARKGDIILSKGYGWADESRKIPNSPSTVFNIGSITKQFTAAGILKLMEQEKLTPSDKIARFFPEAPEDKKNITLHQLLTHSSGISPSTGGFRYDEASKEQFLKEFYEAGLISEPGNSYQYANANYIMLAAIIEDVTGQDYKSFLREYLWAPSELKATGYKKYPFQPDRIAHGYYYHYSTGQWKDWGITFDYLPQNENHWYSIGKGDIYSTTEDLFKWHQALERNTVLTKESRMLMETPFMAENESGSSHYGYGWAIFESETGGKIITHNGSNGIYFADFIRFKEDEVVIIVLSNAILGSSSQNAAWEISRIISNPDYQPMVIPKNVYELMYDFMRTHKPDQAEQLPEFLKQHMASESLDRVILNRLGFALLKMEENPEWGLEWLKLNVELFPEDGNLWDSLGEAYFRYNQNEKALNSFNQALFYGEAADRCYWCENSSEKIEIITNN